MALLFTLLVLLGFIAKFIASLGARHAEQVAWGLWFVAALLWAIGRITV